MKCVLGKWLETLDPEDREAFKRAISTTSRADLYGAICAAAGQRPFGLTALKNHALHRCVCN